MSKISFEQISENEIEVIIPAETPMSMVEQMTKGFKQKGLIEDLAKSTLGTRYFYRPENKAVDLADKLIKSLSALAKDDELPYWHPKAQMANQKRVREMEIGERRAKLGIKQPTNVSPAPEPMVMPDTPSIKPPAPAAPSVNTAPPITDTYPAAQVTAGGTGRRYATIPDPVGKAEHVKGCQCDACLDMEKSGYGPKGGGQYSVADNSKRKANNTGDVVGAGPNVNAKAYSTKPGQLSGKAQADLTSRIQMAANKKQPIKSFTPEQIAAENAKRGLKKTEWGQHLPFPSAEDEIMKLAHLEQEARGEFNAAQQLAKMMNSKAMLRPDHRQPTQAEFDAAGEAMGLAVTEDMAKAAEQGWNNTLNSWLVEATKPISQRFRNEQEELDYWSNIKIQDRDDSQSGY